MDLRIAKRGTLVVVPDEVIEQTARVAARKRSGDDGPTELSGGKCIAVGGLGSRLVGEKESRARLGSNCSSPQDVSDITAGRYGTRRDEGQVRFRSDADQQQVKGFRLRHDGGIESASVAAGFRTLYQQGVDPRAMAVAASSSMVTVTITNIPAP